MQGYIKLYRKTMCSPIWQDPYYFKLWMYCLMKATHKEPISLLEIMINCPSSRRIYHW